MAGKSAYGTLIGYSTEYQVLDLSTAPVSWDYLGEVTNIGGPSVTVDTIDVTSHDSSTDAYREFVASLIDGGDITIEGNLIDAAAGNEIVDLLNERISACWRVQFPTAAGSTGFDWLFAGILNNFETDAPHDGKISFSAGVKLTAKPVLTSTYST
jgi:predicted secreted protein